MPKPTLWLTIDLCKQIYTEVLSKLFSKNNQGVVEAFETRFPERLEALLGAAKQAALLQDFDIAQLACYYLIKTVSRHPFIDANKRAAVAFCLAYLWLEGYQLNLDPQGLYEGTVFIAETKYSNEEQMIKVLVQVFKEHELIVKR